MKMIMLLSIYATNTKKIPKQQKAHRAINTFLSLLTCTITEICLHLYRFRMVKDRLANANEVEVCGGGLFTEITTASTATDTDKKYFAFAIQKEPQKYVCRSAYLRGFLNFRLWKQ